MSATRLGIALIALIVLGATGLTDSAAASHYRGGDISYQQTGAPTNVAIQSTTSFRCDAYFFVNCATEATPGATVFISEATLNFGDGTTSDFQYIVVASNPAENYFTARKDVSHNYPDTTRRNAFYSSCCTISALNNNNDAGFQQFVDINLPQDANSPKTSVPPVVNVGTSGNQTFIVSATDPGGQTLFWRLANGTESGAGLGAQVNPPGLTINSSNGQVSWNTTGVAQGLWHATAVVEARSGSSTLSATHVTFLINVGQGVSNQPPAFVSPPTPANGTEFTVAPGSNLSFNVRANDPDSGDTVTLVPGPLPPGATFTETPGNPANGSFSFTPNAGQDGQDFVVNVTAQDGNGGSVFRSYTIQVRSQTGVNGWMGGEGSLQQGTRKLNYAYLMDCDPNVNPKFQGRLGTQSFNVSDVTSQTCTETAATQAKPSAPFDTMEGAGQGTVGGAAVTVEWEFVDGGLAHNGDSASIKITRNSDSVVLFDGSGSPPGPYQTATRPGRNTANQGNCPC